MNPADELRTAAETLRAAAPEITGRLAGLADPAAAWLEEEAKRHDAAIAAAANIWGSTAHADAIAWLDAGAGKPSPNALALARAINGARP
jgi:hypothetical protein